MKTRTFSVNQSINSNPLQCEKRSFTLSFSWRWLRELGHSMRVQMNHWRLVHALKEVHAGLVALVLSMAARINLRILLGLGAMGVVAPLMACSYLLFDRVDFVQGWYHVNYFHLFFLLGPHLFILTCLFGAYLLFPEGSKRGYMLSVPAGYTIAKILWLITATSNPDFWSIVPMSFILIGMLISLVLFFTVDWLVHNKFHGEDKHEVSFETLYNGADMVSDAEFKRMFKSVMEAKKAFNSKY